VTGPVRPRPASPALPPLFLAGFTTAFGAHSVAAVLGSAATPGAGLLALGLVLAVYDLAEVVLKPVFGALSDRIGPKPVIVGGLVGFMIASLAGTLVAGAAGLALIRFAQGAAASAFSPASSAAVARLAPKGGTGGAFGKYGSWKGLGYAGGPLLGAALVALGGFPLLSAALAAVALAAAVWVLIAVPSLPPMPRRRATLADLVRESTAPAFLRPVVALAAAAGVLVTAIGFLPATGKALGLGVLATTAAASVLAIASALTQPRVGRALDEGRIAPRAGMSAGLLLAAAGVALVALLPTVVTLYLAAVAIGIGVGVATPLGFALLARSADPATLGRTMGTAELGRELGDAGAPTLAGAVAALFGLGAGLGALALVVAGAAIVPLVGRRPAPVPAPAE
jgi:MFS family permease